MFSSRNEEAGSYHGPHSIDQHHNFIIQDLCSIGQLERALDGLSHMPPGLVPCHNTYLSLLKSCIKRKALPCVRLLQAYLTHQGIELTPSLGGFVVIALAKCGATEDALYVSAGLAFRTIISWTAIVSSCADRGDISEALDIFQHMKDDRVSPNAFTYASLFKACGSTMDLTQGRFLHMDAIKGGFTSDVFVNNTLVSMYGKCGALKEAEHVFGALPHQTVVSWATMLSAYVEQGHGARALMLFRQMHEEGTCANQHIFVYALQACSTLLESEGASWMSGKQHKTWAMDIIQGLHVDAIRNDLASDVVVGTALHGLYGKCRALLESESVFAALVQRDIVAWNAMLSTYNENLHEEKVLLLYQYMYHEGMSPNQHTYAIVLDACANMAQKDEASAERKSMILAIGQELHNDAKRSGYVSDVFVGTALLNMYCSCGAILDAEAVFVTLPQRNIVTWTAMLSAYVEHGYGEEALMLHSQMKELLSLDDVMVLSVLQACAEVGSLEVCRQLHFGIASAGYDGIYFVAATLIHTYGSCASMVDGRAVLTNLTEPTLESWNACIAGHTGEGNSTASLCMFEEMKLAGRTPDEITFHSVLSVCSRAGLIVSSCGYFESMSSYGNVTPTVKHQASMVDLLGRMGDIKKAIEWIQKMPMDSDSAVWSCILCACRIHGNIELAKQAFDQAVRLEPKLIGAYIVMSNMYAEFEQGKEVGGVYGMPGKGNRVMGQK